MRFQQLSRDGKYTKKGHKKSLYGTMVYIRAALVVSSASNLAKYAHAVDDLVCVGGSAHNPALLGS